MSPLYSIIIPVYNVESYLCECVDSILQQDFRDFEVVLIDDGSSDGSGAICDSYAVTDSRVKVFHQANKGLSCARNIGIQMAVGEYLIFIDGDDFIATGSLKMIAAMIDGNPNVDIVVVRLVHYFDDSGETKSIYGKYQIERIENKPPSAAVLAYLMSNEIDNCWSASNYIYRRHLITDNKMFFTEQIFFEDLDWTPGAILRALICRNTAFAIISPAIVLINIGHDSLARNFISDRQKRHVRKDAPVLEYEYNLRQAGKIDPAALVQAKNINGPLCHAPHKFAAATTVLLIIIAIEIYLTFISA